MLGTSLIFFVLFLGKQKKPCGKTTHKPTIIVPKSTGDFSLPIFLGFFVIVRVVKPTFLMLLLKTLLAYPRIFQLSGDFGLKFLAYKDPQRTKCQSFCFLLSEITTSDHGLCHISKHEISLQDGYSNLVCGNRLQRRENIFCTVRVTAAPHFQITWNKHLVCPQRESKS